MKRRGEIVLVFAATAVLFGGCMGKPVALWPDYEGGPSGMNDSLAENTPMKMTGLSVLADLSGCRSASAAEGGLAQADITIVAVVVDEKGIITDCVIDAVTSVIEFDTFGQITTDTTQELLSRNELGAAYGMKAASSIGKEWNEQAAALADYVKGKHRDEIKAMAVNERGAPVSADISASVTVSIRGFLDGIEAAALAAKPLGAAEGDSLCLVMLGETEQSSAAASGQNGAAISNINAAAVTFSGERISSCVFDAVQTVVHFSETGEIATDTTQPQRSKNALADSYGMKEVSSIGKEWYEQAAAFAAYVQGKTVAEVSGIAVDERGSAAEADLRQSVTIRIGDFLRLLQKAVP